MSKTALVLEGGAMRGVFTSGVLDVLMENNIDFDCVVGVSAGAMIGSNFLTKQIGRTAKININFCDDSRYIGLKAFKRNKGLVGFDFLFNTLNKTVYAFDEEKFKESNTRFVVGATNVETGKTEFFEKDEKNIYKILQASSSMPVVSDIVELYGKKYLDGAIDCNVPIKWALSHGYDKILVVLTRDEKYVKEEDKHIVQKLYQRRYPKYPKLVRKICSRPERYNELYQEIKEMEKAGDIFVIRPSGKITVSRLEKDKEKLTGLYEEAKEITKKKLNKLKKYLGE